jgi:hypothetical protein
MPQACHDAAIRTRTIFEQVVNFGIGEYGPRLSKLFYLGAFALALAGRPLIDLPELFTLGAAHLRAAVGALLYEFMSAEWRALDVLGEKNPSRFLEYSESLVSRLMPIFGNARFRRIFGQEKGIDLAHMLAHREVALLNLALASSTRTPCSSAPPTSCCSTTRRCGDLPTAHPRACCMTDEVFDYLTPDLARGFDRLRKRNIQLCIAAQRLGQLQGDTHA